MLTRLQLGRLVVPEDPNAPASVRPLLAAIRRGDDLVPVIKETASHFGGCENFEYGLITHPRRDGRGRYWLYTTLDDAWERLWDEQDFAEVDPRITGLHNTQLSGYPVLWTCADVRARADGDAKSLAFADAAAVHGVGSGVAFSLPDDRVQRATVSWSMADPNPSRARLERMRSRIGEMLLWSNYWHSHIMPAVVDGALQVATAPAVVAPPATKSPVTLSPRQRACLALCADGLFMEDVAQKLGTTPRTVQAHLASAREKLGARTTAHAIAVAIRLGLIN